MPVMAYQYLPDIKPADQVVNFGKMGHQKLDNERMIHI